ncbi:MAG: LPXTG cell wall anchor domain-containing protein [Eubacterium sp.]|nr:LPXTG cell wall anchor domain-containing protein [Eubacterium sp.]
MTKKKKKLRGLSLLLSFILCVGFCLGGIPSKVSFADSEEQDSIQSRDSEDGQDDGQNDGQNDGQDGGQDGGQEGEQNDQGEQNNARQIQIKFAGADKGSGVYEFTVDDIVFTATFFIGDTVSDTINEAKDTWTVTEGDNAKIRFSDTFDRDNYDVVLASITDDFTAKLTMTGDNEALVFDDGYNLQDTMQLTFVKKDNEQNEPGPQGNSVAVINISGPEGSWNLAPIVYEPYDVENSDGTFSAPYSRYAFVADLSINGGSRTEGIGHYDKKADIAGLATQEIGFNKGDNDTSASFTFATNWGDRIEEIIINNKKYNVPLNYDNRYDWLVAFNGQNISFDIDVDLPQPDKDGKYNFDVQLKVRPITEKECFIGNFLWSKDEHFAPDGPDPSDLYIGHSSLILESVDFNNGKENIHWQIDVEDDGTDQEYAYEKDGIKYDYAHFSMKYPPDDCSMGEMVIPEGAAVTMKIVPEYGYQVKYFTGVDFDEGNVKLQGGQCEFTFIVGRGNFHIGAKVEEQADDVVSESSIITGGGVVVPEGLINSGSARINITDPELSEDKKDEFLDVAFDEGLDIKAIVDLNLKQVYFKGMGDDTQVWENDIDLTKMDDDESILVGLEMPEGMTEEDGVAIIHNIDDGEEFEVIEPLGIVDGLVVFETRGFSNYALAVEDAFEEPSDDWDRVDVKDKDTGVSASILAPDSADNYKLVVEDELEGDSPEEIAAVKKAMGIPDEYEVLRGYSVTVVSSDPDVVGEFYGRKPIISIPISDLTDKYENFTVLAVYDNGAIDEDGSGFDYEFITPTIKDGMAVFEAEIGGTFVILGIEKKAAQEADIEPAKNADTSPATGDSSDPALMFMLLIASAGMIILLRKKSKEDGREQ